MSVRKIANRLNISPSTVSLALRGDTKISADTRMRVEAEADRIGYRRDAKLNQLMAQLRHCGSRSTESCLAFLSLGDGSVRPWERSEQARRAYRALAERSERLGYRVEPFYLRGDGMSPKRLRTIFETRRIEGVFCFAEEWAGEAFPEELLGNSVVSVGAGFSGLLNSVMPDYFGDVARTCDRLRAEGARRIGLVLSKDLAPAVASRYLGAFLSQQADLGEGADPYCRVTKWNLSWVEEWMQREGVDRLVCAGLEVAPLQAAAERAGLAAAGRIAALDLDDAEGYGMRHGAELMGRQAVEMLVRSVTHREFGLPEHPKQELVCSEWVDTQAAAKDSRGLKAVAC